MNVAEPQGTTSACAENTARSNGVGGWTWNYLRVRGEYEFSDGAASAASELPPRARRIHSGGENGIFQPGTTSACAENTK